MELLRWDSRHTAPEGRIVEILGAVGKTSIDMLGVLRQYDLTGDFGSGFKGGPSLRGSGQTE